MNKSEQFNKSNVQILVKSFLHDWSAIEYEDNPPSALQNEQRYAQYGIKLPFKLHYNYKIPFGLESSYDLLFWYYAATVPDAVSFDDLPGVWSMNMDNLSPIDKKRLDLYKSFSDEQIKAIYEYLAQWTVDDMIEEIKRLNPELANIKMDGKESGVSRPVQDFICGVAYGFPPEDIKLCLESKRGELQKVADNPRYQKLKYGHFTTPEHYEILLQAEQQIQQIQQAKQNNGKE